VVARIVEGVVAQLTAGGSLRTPMSWNDFQSLGETKHHEYYDGLTVVNPPSRRHVLVTKRLTRLLDQAAPAGHEALPEFGWQPADRTVFEPDVMLAATDAPGSDVLRAPPLIVVEVTSPSTRSDDLGRKMRAYAQGAAPWYWIADPDAGSLVVYRLTGGTYVEYSRGSTARPLELTEPLVLTIDLVALFG